MNIDYLQIALLFLIILLSIFLTITGVQVFLILRDLKKALDKFNKVIQTGEVIAEDIEKPITVASNLVTDVGRAATDMLRRRIKSTPKPRRFYKKIL